MTHEHVRKHRARNALPSYFKLHIIIIGVILHTQVNATIVLMNSLLPHFVTIQHRQEEKSRALSYLQTHVN